jgi:hypothetical protein
VVKLLSTASTRNAGSFHGVGVSWIRRVGAALFRILPLRPGRRVEVAVPQTSATTLPSGAYVVTCTGPETELVSMLICRSRSTTLDPVNEAFMKLS